MRKRMCALFAARRSAQHLDRVCGRATCPERPQGNVKDSRSVAVPPHRFTPLKEQWLKIYTPIVENMKLQIRMNLKSRRVEIRVRVHRWRLSGTRRQARLTPAAVWPALVTDVRVHGGRWRAPKGRRLCAGLHDGL